MQLGSLEGLGYVLLNSLSTCSDILQKTCEVSKRLAPSGCPLSEFTFMRKGSFSHPFYLVHDVHNIEHPL